MLTRKKVEKIWQRSFDARPTFFIAEIGEIPSVSAFLPVLHDVTYRIRRKLRRKIRRCRFDNLQH